MYGVQFSKLFADEYERERWTWSFGRVLMNLHNNEAGRKVINFRCICVTNFVEGYEGGGGGGFRLSYRCSFS